MKRVAIILFVILCTHPAFAEGDRSPYSLQEVIEVALRNNPKLKASGKDVELEKINIEGAKAERLPRIDFSSGITRYRYPAPITPIAGSPLNGSGFPEFSNTVYDAGAYFILPLYRGGRLVRGIEIAQLQKLAAEDTFSMSRQDLIYNLTSTFYKIIQLKENAASAEAAVEQLKAHKRNVELFLQAGTVPRIELLKTESELAHAQQSALLTRNNLQNAYELLKTLMGIGDPDRQITVVSGAHSDVSPLPLKDSIERGLSQRSDYQAMIKQQRVAEEKIALARGKKLPAVNLTGEYFERTGNDAGIKENWNVALRLTLPLFDGGAIASEVNRERKALEKLIEEGKALRLDVIREIKEAHLGIANAQERIGVTKAALEVAQEGLRVELLKYQTGAGTSTDVIDAQTALLRAEADYTQALYDKDIAYASLQRAMGAEVVK